MRTIIGLGVGATTLRAVAIRGGAVRWAMEAETTPGEPLAGALGELLAAAPIRRWPRPVVVAAVGASRAQTKRLAGLPPVTDPRTLAELVREGASRFFLKNGVPLVTSGARLVEPGTAWAAAVEAPLLRELAEACRMAKVALRAVVPAAVVLGAALEADAEGVVWWDGAVASLLTFQEGHLAGARRVGLGAAAGADEPPRPVAPLAVLGDGAWRFADAYGAARLSTAEPLAVRPRRDTQRAGSVPRRRGIVAAGACIVSLAAALLAPGLAASHGARTAAAKLAALGTQRREAVVMGRELRHVTAALAQVAAFDSARTSATLLLETLTRTLPTGSALVTLRVDSTTGTIVTLAPRAGAVVTALDRTPGIATPEIMGPVTREVVGTSELERATIRFRLITPVRTPTSASVDSTAGTTRQARSDAR